MSPYVYLFAISSIFSLVASVLFSLAVCSFIRSRNVTVSEGTLETTESPDRFWSVVPFDFTDGSSLAALLNKDDDDYFWTVEYVLPGCVVLSRAWEGGDYVDSDEKDGAVDTGLI